MTVDDNEHFWVFGYGSLMWRPEIEFSERRLATVYGFHRSLCVYSHVHRGTPARPGLVLGLDRGGACCGVAFKVHKDLQKQTIQYLREREMVTSVYREIQLRARVDDGRQIIAIAYAADINHIQYAGRLPREQLLRHVLQGEGISGHNRDYILNTNQHLDELGLCDADLAWLCQQIFTAGVNAISG